MPAYTDRVLFTRRTPAGPLPPDWAAGDIVTYSRAELKVGACAVVVCSVVTARCPGQRPPARARRV